MKNKKMKKEINLLDFLGMEDITITGISINLL